MPEDDELREVERGERLLGHQREHVLDLERGGGGARHLVEGGDVAGRLGDATLETDARLVQARDHLVERRRELAHLVVGADRDRLPRAAGCPCDPACHPRHHLDRPRQAAREEEALEERQEEARGEDHETPPEHGAELSLEIAPLDDGHHAPPPIAEWDEGNDTRAVDAVHLVAVMVGEDRLQNRWPEPLVGDRVRRTGRRQDGAVAIDEVGPAGAAEPHHRLVVAPPRSAGE